MSNIILGTIIFALSFVIRLVVYWINKKRKKRKRIGGVVNDMTYLINRFKLDKEKVDKWGIAAVVSLMDAFIISITFIIVISVTDNIPLQLVLGLVVVIAMILFIYEIAGTILVKRGYGRK